MTMCAGEQVRKCVREPASVSSSRQDMDAADAITALHKQS